MMSPCLILASGLCFLSLFQLRYVPLVLQKSQKPKHFTLTTRHTIIKSSDKKEIQKVTSNEFIGNREPGIFQKETNRSRCQLCIFNFLPVNFAMVCTDSSSFNLEAWVIYDSTKAMLIGIQKNIYTLNYNHLENINIAVTHFMVHLDVPHVNNWSILSKILSIILPVVHLGDREIRRDSKYDIVFPFLSFHPKINLCMDMG